jgi:hypothetical protein
MSGCHCADGECQCTVFQISEVFDKNRATPITRMFLHNMFNRQYRLDDILKKFTDHFDGKNNDENGLEYMKKLILTDCATDPTWKICPKCEIEYNNKTRNFEKIVFIVPHVDLCVEHFQNLPDLIGV